MNEAPTVMTVDDVVKAAALAASAWATSNGMARAALLLALAKALNDEAGELVQLADEETSLGVMRLKSELARTALQLRRFADEAAAGTAVPSESRPLRKRAPRGPVAIFASGDFPFALSVLGSATAWGLAAGCAVVVKAHPRHPKLSRRVHELALSVIQEQQLPGSLLGFVEGASVELQAQLLNHPQIAAAAFAG